MPRLNLTSFGTNTETSACVWWWVASVGSAERPQVRGGGRGCRLRRRSGPRRQYARESPRDTHAHRSRCTEYVDKVDSDFDASESSAEQEEVDEERPTQRSSGAYKDPRAKGFPKRPLALWLSLTPAAAAPPSGERAGEGDARAILMSPSPAVSSISKAAVALKGTAPSLGGLDISFLLRAS